MSKEQPKRVDLSSLRADRRKRGRTATSDPKLVAELAALSHGEGLPYTEANCFGEAYLSEQATALPIIMRDKKCDEQEAQAVFQNRWLSRYRQRAQAAWALSSQPDKEMDFVVLNDGTVYIGRK
jgi:hypothetical protein